MIEGFPSVAFNHDAALLLRCDASRLHLTWQLVFRVDINKMALCCCCCCCYYCCCCDREAFPPTPQSRLDSTWVFRLVENSITILLFGVQMENVDDAVIFYSQLGINKRHAWWMNESMNGNLSERVSDCMGVWVYMLCIRECTHVCHMRFPLRIFMACLQLIRIVMSPFNSIIVPLFISFPFLFFSLFV